jgi:hypothetical protein
MMADIDVVPKHRSTAWVWIVISAIVVLALWWIVAGGHGPRSQTGQVVLPSNMSGAARDIALATT